MSGLSENMPTKQSDCESHGPYESKNYMGNIWSHCPKCAKEESDKQEEIEREQEAAEVKRRWEARVKQASIPKRFADRAFDSYSAESAAQKKALQFCVEFVEGFESVKESGRSALFCGKPGTGKTHLAASIGIEVMRKHKATVLFSTVMRTVRRIKATWGKGSQETESQVIDLYTAPDLLILDEVGVQFGSETEENYIFDIINERYEEKRSTIIISNLGVDGIKKYLGDRAFDRLREDGGKLIPFTWASYRGKTKAN